MGFRLSVNSLLLCLLAGGTLMAQPNRNGVPIITNYNHAITKGSEQNWCITQDARGVMYIGNNNKGVLEYDGVEWRRIPVPKDPIVRSLVTGADGVVYVGAVSEFGFLSPNEVGDMKYISLSDTIDLERDPFTDVLRTYSSMGKIYFCTYDRIYIYDPLADRLRTLKTHHYSFFSFVIDSTIFVSDFGRGLMWFKGDSIMDVPGGDFFIEKSISGLVKFDETRLLAGTEESGIFLFDLETGAVDVDFIDSELKEYFKNGSVAYIRPLGNDFLIASYYNGVVIINRNGEPKEIINESEGLINEDIPFVYSNDESGGTGPLWIAHFMGVSKLELNSPFRVFTEKDGFEGFITDIIEFKEHLFVSTFEGLYYKRSDALGTLFIPIPEIQGEIINNLYLFNPSKYVELLLATTETKTYVIDRYMNVSELGETIVNPSENPQDRGEYAGQYLVQDPKQPDRIFTGRTQIVGLEYTRGRWKEVVRFKGLPEEELLRKRIDKYGFLWANTDRKVIRIDLTHMEVPEVKIFTQENGLPFDDNNQVFLNPESSEVLLGTKDGFYLYDYFRDTIFRDTFYNSVLPAGDNFIMAFHRDHDGDYWYSFENEYSGWTEMVARQGENQLDVIREKSFQRLDNTSSDVFYSNSEGAVWFGKSNKLYHFDKTFSRNDTIPFRTLIRNVVIGRDSLIFNGTHFTKNSSGQKQIDLTQSKDAQPQITYRYNHIRFSWASTFFEQEEELRYCYRLKGFEEEWSEWKAPTFKEFTNLPFGSFTMEVKTRNIYGKESIPASYSFTVLRPWYAHFLAFIAYFLLLGLVIYTIIKLYTYRLKQENIRLEGIIQERTAEIRKQKEELTDSIEYASRIQRALLPTDRLLDEHNIDHFLLFRPRDIVSGDFYWMTSKNGKLLIVAADCTGHGVPGAFMSMLGMTFLDEIVIKANITNTNEILGQLREHVITSLKQSGKGMIESTRDGMDLSMISVDLNTRELQYSGAYNPLYLVRKLNRSEKLKLKKGEDLELDRGSIHDDKHLLLHIRADQMPIGISEEERPFNVRTFKNEGYSIYMFSDGFRDQFGGPRRKKFMSKNFKKMILELQSVPLNKQGAAMEKVLMGWMGEISQIDDILVMGLRMKVS